MLDDKEKNKIKELIKQGKTDYKIGKLLNHSSNTIKVVREELLKEEESQIHKEEVHYDSSIDYSRRIIGEIGNIIKTHNLKEKEKKDLEKLLESFKKTVRSEVDDRIAAERADAVEKRNQEWNKYIEEHYVKKEVVTDLENKIIIHEKILKFLRNEIKVKDDSFIKNQFEYSQYKKFKQSYTEFLEREILRLIKENNLIEENQGLQK